jgi:hypothetical protein
MSVPVDLCEKIAWKVFDGRYPDVAPQLLAVCILESLPAFQDASVAVREHFLEEFTPLLFCRMQMQKDAGDADSSAEWKS